MKKMNLLIIIFSFIFIFLMIFGGTILGKLLEDYRTYKRQTLRRLY